MRSHFLTCLTLAFLLAAGARAQEPSASHLQAAEDLLQTTNYPALLERNIEAMLEAEITANPQLKPFKDIMHQFMIKYLSWETLKPEAKRIYVEAFTEAELRELAAFYQTPLGKKALTKMPEIFQQAAIIGQKTVRDHLPELQAAIAKKVAEGSGSQKEE